MNLPTPLEMSVLGAALLVGAGALFWFVPTLIKIALGMGAIGLLLLACAGVAYDYELMGEAKIKPQVDAAKVAQKLAETQRDNAKADMASCVALTQVQNDEIGKWKGTAEKNAANAKSAKAQAQAQAAAAAPKIAELQAAAAAKPQLMACQVELDKTKTILLQNREERRKLFEELQAKRLPTK